MLKAITLILMSLSLSLPALAQDPLLDEAESNKSNQS